MADSIQEISDRIVSGILKDRDKTNDLVDYTDSTEFSRWPDWISPADTDSRYWPGEIGPGSIKDFAPPAPDIHGLNLRIQEISKYIGDGKNEDDIVACGKRKPLDEQLRRIDNRLWALEEAVRVFINKAKTDGEMLEIIKASEKKTEELIGCVTPMIEKHTQRLEKMFKRAADTMQMQLKSMGEKVNSLTAKIS